jgi:hypothetical protein
LWPYSLSSPTNEDDHHEGGAAPRHHCTLAVVIVITAHTTANVVYLTHAPNNINSSLTRDDYDVVIVVCGGECGSVNVVAHLFPLPTFADGCRNGGRHCSMGQQEEEHVV